MSAAKRHRREHQEHRTLARASPSSFGPLGKLYSTIWGALVMIVLSVPLFFLTFGHTAFLVWPISMIWGAWAAHSYNQRLLRRAGLSPTPPTGIFNSA